MASDRCSITPQPPRRIAQRSSETRSPWRCHTAQGWYLFDANTLWLCQFLQCDRLQPRKTEYRQVNLGHLLVAGILPMPSSDDSVLFCPSMTTANKSISPDGSRCFDYESFASSWGQVSSGQELFDYRVPVSYMFNTGLDGFGSYVQKGRWAVLAHDEKVNFLLGDGSAHTFRIQPLVFDQAVGPELLTDVMARHGVCFPTIMLHKWWERGRIDLAQAQQYLADPQG